MAGMEEYIPRAGFSPRQQASSQHHRSGLVSKPDEHTTERLGKIVKALQIVNESGETRVVVQIRFDDTVAQSTQSSYPNGFILSHTVEEIALLFGGIDDLIGHTVALRSTSTNQPQGIATIVARYGAGNLDAANTLKPFGTLLAPAGK